MSADKPVDRVKQKQPSVSGSRAVDAFLNKAQRIKQFVPENGGGRLLFAMDATASREATWDRACHLQSEMFEVAAENGGLWVQLLYYGGFGSCRNSGWVRHPEELHRLMRKVRCAGGQTQIERVLRYAADLEGVSSMVFVGDAVEEKPGTLYDLAGALRLKQRPCFFFQDGNDPAVASIFQEMARLSGGAHARFDVGADAVLRRLLAGVAAYASGGLKGLKRLGERGGSDGASARQLLEQLEKKS